MKSLRKVLNILEYVILQHGDPVTPTMAASALELNLATTARILQELTAGGYLVQISRKEGYISGPMVSSISTRKNVFTRLADAAEEPLKELSRALGVQVNIAVMNGIRRIMLRLHDPHAGFTPWDHFFFTDHWAAATGRLLIAALEDPEARRVCAACGIEPYPAVELAEIRQNGFVRFPQNQLMVMGRMIRVPGFPHAAFGFGVPLAETEKAFRRSAATAEAICSKLQQKNQIF